MEHITIAAGDRERAHALHAEILGLARTRRATDVALGKGLREMRERGWILFQGVTDFPLYCEQKVGLSSAEGWELFAAAAAIALAPALEGKMLEGNVSVAKAAAVGKVLKDPELARPGEDWLQKAETESTKALRRLVKERLAEKRAGGRVEHLEAFLTPGGMEEFDRARTLVSRKQKRPVSEGETIEAVVHDYLEHHDPERRALRQAEKDAKTNGNGALKRETHGREKSRHIPAAVLREVLRTYGDRCMVDGCENEVFLHYAHRRPFSVGGQHVAWNLVRLCRYHHAQMDAGVWRPVLKRDGTIVMIGEDGTGMGWFREPRQPGNEAKPPP